ncbi:hypothetical protein CIW54_22855 [Paraburkholderia sp. T12-10]|nr:hypothetical protein CIW54_22855 [Paraburkholderia sp. T12-10]
MDAAAVVKKSRDAFAVILGSFPGCSAMCQRARMLAAMNQFENVTTLEAMRFLDVYDPRPRVHELRRAGYWIRTTRAMQVTESGEAHVVGAYSLADTDDPIAGPARADGWVQMTLPWGQEPIAGADLVQP